MQCLCLMREDRICPEDCPLVVWAKLSPDDRKAQRKPIAERLYRKGLTMEAIGAELGVSHMTIVRDLREFEHDVQTQPRTSARGRKGEGRPKSKPNGANGHAKERKPSPKMDRVQPAVDQLVQAGKGVPRQKLAAEYGVGERTVQMAYQRAVGRSEAEPSIAFDTLSMTGQQKVEAAIRAYKKQLDASFEKEVVARNQAHWKEYFPTMQQRLNDAHAREQQYRDYLAQSKKIFTVGEYKTILMVLHPDGDRSAEKRAEAFRLFSAKRFALTGEDA